MDDNGVPQYWIVAVILLSLAGLAVFIGCIVFGVLPRVIPYF